MDLLNTKYFYTQEKVPSHLKEVIYCFERNSSLFDSEIFTEKINSNFVLECIRQDLEKLNFQVEKKIVVNGKKKIQKLKFEIQTKKLGILEFHADAYNSDNKTIIEVEAGRAVVNNQFLKDIYQASVIENCEYLIIAVKKKYRKNGKDFDKVSKFVDGIFPNPLIKLRGILVIGY